jgi:hypothetical protein
VCLPGFGWLDASNKTCSLCPASTFSTGGAPASAQCQACGVNTTTAAAGSVSSTACSLCVPGTGGVASCSTCPPGSFGDAVAVGANCTGCPQSSTSFAGAASASQCFPGELPRHLRHTLHAWKLFEVKQRCQDLCQSTSCTYTSWSPSAGHQVAGVKKGLITHTCCLQEARPRWLQPAYACLGLPSRADVRRLHRPASGCC